MKNSFKSIILIFVGILLFSSCASPLPPHDQYRLDIKAPLIKVEKSNCRTKSLKVQNAYGDNSLMSLNMYYVQGKYNQYAYSRAKWAQTPQTMITKVLTEYIRAMQLFQSVQNSDSKTKNDFILEITIDDFMQYFDESGQNSFVRFSITCTLVDMKKHRVFAVKTFTKNIKTTSNNAIGGVQALSSALSVIIKECGMWLKGAVCND